MITEEDFEVTDHPRGHKASTKGTVGSEDEDKLVVDCCC
jgi:hypothetical protein